jgi:predicted outer membrane repeat protein
MAAQTKRWAIALLAGAVLALSSAGCGKSQETEIWGYALHGDTDTDTGTEEDPDTEPDECPDYYLDDKGRCIRYVDFESDGVDCGLNWETAFTEIQPAIDAAYAAAIQLGHCEVWVAEGTYYSYENSPADSIRLKPNVTVYGGFAGDEVWLTERDLEAHETIIDGTEQGGEGHSYHVVMGANDSDLDGFTVTGGRAYGDAPHHRGGGIYLNASNTTVNNCTIIDNEAIDGGGIFAYDSVPVVEASEVVDNRAVRGGGMLMLNGYALIGDTLFENNSAEESGGGVYFEKIYSACYPIMQGVEFVANTAEIDGGAVYNISCNPSIDVGSFEDNEAGERGGAIATYRGSLDVTEAIVTGNRAAIDGGGFYGKFTDTAISHCEFERNQALRHAGGAYCELTDAAIYASSFVLNTAAEDGGALTVYFDEPRLTNTLISGNEANRGAGIFNGTRAETAITNCTLHGNLAADAGGGLYNAYLSEPDVYNTIVWGNDFKEIYDEIGSECTISYSDVRGGYPGSYNIDDDPIFAGPGFWNDNDTPLDESDDVWVEGDYHLLAISPCIDAANDEVSPTYDAEGKTWADMEDTGLPGNSVDMGIYDFQP